MLYVQFCAPADGRRNRLKHVEQFIEINRSRKRCVLLVVLYRSYTVSVVSQIWDANAFKMPSFNIYTLLQQSHSE